MSKKIITLISLSLIIFGLGIISFIKFNSADLLKNTVKVTNNKNTSKKISFDGVVTAEKSANLGFQMSGKLVSLLYKVGDQVKKGTVLAKIDKQSASAEYNQAITGENMAKLRVNQLKQSLKSEKLELKKLRHAGNRDKEIQKAKVNEVRSSISEQEEVIKHAQSNVRLAKINLNKTNIIAPFTGTITKQAVEIGETVTANVSIISLETINNLKLEGYVSQAQLGKIKIGNQAQVVFGASGNNTPVNAHIVMIDPSETIINNAPAYKITLAFENQPENIKPGISANINILKN